MHRRISIFLSIFLSVLTVYGGSGINTCFYCCNDCRMAGAKAIMEHLCCEIHSHQGCALPHHETPACDLSEDAPSGTCGITRIHFDWQSFTGSSQQLQPVVIDLNNTFFSDTAKVAPIAVYLTFSSSRYGPSQKPPNLSKEDYFSLLTILII